MVNVIISDEKLILALPESKDYFVKPLEFPWEHITGVETDSAGAAHVWYARLMVFAANIPDVIRPGVYYEDGKNVFWGIDDPEKVIAISLKDEPYEKLFIQVEDRRQAIESIENALKGKTGDSVEPENSAADDGESSENQNGGT